MVKRMIGKKVSQYYCCNGDGIAGNVIYKGEINVPADFPLLADVQTGWFYTIGTDVTDNDPSRTNTGQSFVVGEDPIWADTKWGLLGPDRLWVEIAGELKPINADNINLVVGKEYKINNIPISFDRIKKIYVSPQYGNNLRSGIRPEFAVADVAQAIIIANSLTPSFSNIITIICTDGSTIDENITLPEFVNIDSKNSDFNGGDKTINVVQNSSIAFRSIKCADLNKTGVGIFSFECKEFFVDGQIDNTVLGSVIFGNVDGFLNANTNTLNGAVTNIRAVNRIGTDVSDDDSQIIIENLTNSFYTQKSAARLTCAAVVKHPTISLGTDNLPSFNAINCLVNASITGTLTINLKNPTASYQFTIGVDIIKGANEAATAIAIANAINTRAVLNTRVAAQAIGTLCLVVSLTPGNNNDWTVIMSNYAGWSRNFEHFIGGGTNKIKLNGEVVVSFRSTVQENPEIFELRKTYTNFEITDPYASPGTATPGTSPVTTCRFINNSGELDIAFDNAVPNTESVSLYPYFAVSSHPTLTNIEYTSNIAYKVASYAGANIPPARGIGIVKSDGSFIFTGIPTTMQLQKTGGTVYGPAINPTSPLSVNEKTYSPVSPVTFFYGWRTSTIDLTTFNVAPYRNIVIANKYDDGTGRGNDGLPKGVVLDNRWTNQYIYQESVQDIKGIIFFGQTQVYTSSDLALAAIGKDFSAPLIVGSLQLTTVLTIRGGATDLSLAADAIFTPTNKFFQLAGAGSPSTVIFSPVLYENIYHISPSVGNNANSGKSDEAPISTIVYAIALANSLTPSSTKQFNLFLVEAAQISYLFTLTSWIHLNAENTVFTNKVTMDAVNAGDFASMRVQRIKCALADNFALVLDGAGSKQVYLKHGLNNTATNAKGIHMLTDSKAIVISDGEIYASGLEAIKLELNANADIKAPSLHGYISVGNGSKLVAIIDKTISVAEISLGNGAEVKLGERTCDFITDFIAASTDVDGKLFIEGASAQKMDFAGFDGEVYINIDETDKPIIFSGNLLDAKLGRVLYNATAFSIGNNATAVIEIDHLDRQLLIGTGVIGTITIHDTGTNSSVTNNSPTTCQVIIFNKAGKMQIGVPTISSYAEFKNQFGNSFVTIDGSIARITMNNGQIVGAQDIQAGRGIYDYLQKSGRDVLKITTTNITLNSTGGDSGVNIILMPNATAARTLNLMSGGVSDARYFNMIYNMHPTYTLTINANGNTILGSTVLQPYEVGFLIRDPDSSTTFFILVK